MSTTTIKFYLAYFVCKIWGHHPVCIKPVQFADGNYGHVPVFCSICKANEAEMVYDGVDANEIYKMKLKYINNLYDLTYDNMR